MTELANHSKRLQDATREQLIGYVLRLQNEVIDLRSVASEYAREKAVIADAVLSAQVAGKALLSRAEMDAKSIVLEATSRGERAAAELDEHVRELQGAAERCRRYARDMHAEMSKTVGQYVAMLEQDALEVEGLLEAKTKSYLSGGYAESQAAPDRQPETPRESPDPPPSPAPAGLPHDVVLGTLDLGEFAAYEAETAAPDDGLAMKDLEEQSSLLIKSAAGQGGADPGTAENPSGLAVSEGTLSPLPADEYSGDGTPLDLSFLLDGSYLSAPPLDTVGSPEPEDEPTASGG